MDTPALRELMGTYLHQDFDLIGTVDDNVDAFILDFSDIAAALPVEVQALLSRDPSEQELEDLLEALGCQLRPPNGESRREWLTHIADRVRRATAGPA
jgi:hypothetical protein